MPHDERASHAASGALAFHVAQTRDKHTETPYFDRAEALFPAQWSRHIEPGLVGMDFSSVLELACGHGRNTERLLGRVHAVDGELILVDVNDHCLKACRERFAADPRARRADGSSRIRYVLNDGSSLAAIEAGSVSLVYSWDSMVHFHRELMERYVHEFARVLSPGGRGFAHHSNYGVQCDDPERNWTDNPHWRSTMTADLFASYCADAGLAVESQRIIDWRECRGLDCISIFRKP